VSRIALATCAALPNLNADDARLREALAARGAQVDATVWDDPDVDWASYDLIVIRSTWDYAQRRDEFLAWARRVERETRLANPYPVIAWNTDKHYLRELEAAGVRIVPTQWLEPSRGFTSRALHTRFPAHGDFVIKPAVSAGSVDTGRYTAIDAASRGLAINHAKRLLAARRTVMVQRYIGSVDTVGERAHVFVAGEYSHSVLKGAMLDGPDVGVDGVYRAETVSAIEASEREVEFSRQVIRAARRYFGTSADGVDLVPDKLLYARVDVVTDDDDEPVLMELELVEPSLFPALAPDAFDRLADAITARAGA
jgi:glutathione synthase/RimK-type ligase-like ATP-grasp enzyme